MKQELYPYPEGGQDHKFAFVNGYYANRVSGEVIPLEEPIIIFRARDHHAIPILREYLTLINDPHHKQAVRERLAEFEEYKKNYPDCMKEPGITQDIILKD